MRFAYRKDDNLLNRVSAITEGSGHADMIQDLNDVAILGKENTEPLTAISFDLTLLDTAANTANEMGDLLAMVTTDRADSSDDILVRNQAYTHLYEAVDDIRECGQYVFWKNKDRLKGYRSDYLRRQRKARKTAADASKE